MPDINLITGKIIGVAIRIHRDLGSGLFETVYEPLMADGISSLGLKVARQVPVPIQFGGRYFSEGFRADLIVEDCVVVELKSVEQLSPVHSKKLLTYMRLLDFRVGLLINFGGATLKDGIKRIVNNLDEDPVDPERPSAPSA